MEKNIYYKVFFHRDRLGSRNPIFLLFFVRGNTIRTSYRKSIFFFAKVRVVYVLNGEIVTINKRSSMVSRVLGHFCRILINHLFCGYNKWLFSKKHITQNIGRQRATIHCESMEFHVVGFFHYRCTDRFCLKSI